jgi:hypothetical protein
MGRAKQQAKGRAKELTIVRRDRNDETTAAATTATNLAISSVTAPGRRLMKNSIRT